MELEWPIYDRSHDDSLAYMFMMYRDDIKIVDEEETPVRCIEDEEHAFQQIRSLDAWCTDVHLSYSHFF